MDLKDAIKKAIAAEKLEGDVGLRDKLDTLMNDLRVTNGVAVKQISDIVDKWGCQYVDLVMEGGGMLGIALVGYTWALEEIGIRFLGIAGTSAGAINAMLMAALDAPTLPKSDKVLSAMAKQDFFKFVDGGNSAEKIVNLISGSDKGIEKALDVTGIFGVIHSIIKHEGINPGEVFHEWMRDLLNDAGAGSAIQLAGKQRIDNKDFFFYGQGRKPVPDTFKGPSLGLVTADVSTETKVIFPANADLYYSSPDSVHPADYVRASMSIPYFFEPYRVEDVPLDDNAKKRWATVVADLDNEPGIPPKTAVFVDGGVLSNFPISLFHTPNAIPQRPTFGAKLEYDSRAHNIDSALSLGAAIFNSARHCLDYDFIHQNPDYKKLVTFIPCKGFNWLDFNMSDDNKVKLFVEGVKSAVRFVDGFKWN